MCLIIITTMCFIIITHNALLLAATSRDWPRSNTDAPFQPDMLQVAVSLFINNPGM